MNNMNPILLAIFGYALGSAQLFIVDWLNRRRLHKTHIRVIRAEIGRALLNGSQKFNWDTADELKDQVPRPPNVSSKYDDIITSTDFSLTDEHEDDNTQEALLGILDGCNLLEDYVDRILKLADQSDAEPDAGKRLKVADDVKQLTKVYDREHDKVTDQLTDCRRDINRRLKQINFWQQIGRIGRNLPPVSKTTK